MVGCSLNPARGRHGGVREELTAGIKKAPDVPGPQVVSTKEKP